MEVVLNAELFYQRLEHLQDHWYAHKSTVWNSSDALCIPLGAIGTLVVISMHGIYCWVLF